MVETDPTGMGSLGSHDQNSREGGRVFFPQRGLLEPLLQFDFDEIF